jgi:hypothetical protein
MLQSCALEVVPRYCAAVCKCVSEREFGSGESTRFGPVYCLPVCCLGGAACKHLRELKLFDNPHSPGTVAFSRLFDLMRPSGNMLSCPLAFMSCSVALEVMPHSATSRATGDDISTIVDSNAGV